MKVVRLLALRTGRLYLPGNIPGTHFCQRLSRLQGHSAGRRNMSIKISSGTIGNRTRDLPACSAVHQPTVSPGAPHIFQHKDENKTTLFTWEIQLRYTEYNGEIKTVNHTRYFVIFYSTVYCNLFRFKKKTSLKQCKILTKDIIQNTTRFYIKHFQDIQICDLIYRRLTSLSFILALFVPNFMEICQLVQNVQ